MATNELDQTVDVDEKVLETSQQFPIKDQLCEIHNKALEFYCINCKICICQTCKDMDHKDLERKHKPIGISEAFQKFKDTATELEKEVNAFTDNLEKGLREVRLNDDKLERSKSTCLADIDNHVQKLIKKIEDNGNEKKNILDAIYKKKKEVSNKQISELTTIRDDVNVKKIFLKRLHYNKDEATAMKSSDMIVTALKNKLEEGLPQMEPNNDGKIVFLKNECFLQGCNIGNLSQGMTACLQLLGEKDVIQGQQIFAKVIKTGEFEIHASQLKATWTQPTGETYIIPVKKDNNQNYILTRECTSPGICSLDVRIDDEPIEHSPMEIKVERKGLVNTFQIQLKKHSNVSDVVKYEDDCLLVSSLTNELHKYKQSGEYIGTLQLPKSVHINRMYKMKNGDIAFSDKFKKCISIRQITGQEVGKPIGLGLLNDPEGIHVNESSNIVYVADIGRLSCVFIFNIANGQMIRRIGSQQINTDVTLTKEGNLIVLNNKSSPPQDYKPELQLFDSKGNFSQNLGSGLHSKLMNSQGVVVDEDDNIIISSKNKLQLFSSRGYFIKRIDEEGDGIRDLMGLSIISHYPRRVAVADKGNNTIKIFNY